MSIKQIGNEIAYIEASDDPLSADIGIIQSPNGTWLYDVGNDRKCILSLTGKYNVVLSHFHLDHIGNLGQLNIEKLYVSEFTFQHIGQGTVVKSDMYIGNLHIFPLPSSHTKGSLGLEVNNMFAFIGDALYSKSNAEYYIYNAQQVKEEIDVLKKLKAEYLLISHFKGMIMHKDKVIQQLEDIYSHRVKTSPDILIKKHGNE